MKKQLNRFGLAFLFIAAISFTAFTGDQNPNADKGQQKNQGKNKNQGKENKGNDNSNQGKENKGNQKQDDNQPGKNEDKDFKDQKDPNDNNQGNNNKGKKDGYSWNRENFKDRHKIKNQEKVTLCHKFNKGDNGGVTIRVSSNALNAHLNHGDIMGDCPAINNNRYSDDYLRKRGDYYNSLQESHEQVLYSQSVLDYALARLTESRLQLNQYQLNNMPAAQIESKRVVVTELEQNVSLLQTLVGVATELIVNKLIL